MNRSFIIFTSLLALTWVSCQPSRPSASQNTTYRVAFYNVENLFDTLDDPNIRDEEFLPTGKNVWTAERYQIKLDKLSQVIVALDSASGGPDILGLCEVENRAVLEDLVKTNALKAQGYAIAHHSSPDERGIDVAMIYKKDAFAYEGQEAYRLVVPDEPDFLTRDALMVYGKVGGERLHLFINHFPSRSGGQEASEKYRVMVAELVRSKVDSLLAADVQAKFLIMGDFNDMPHNKSIKEVLNTTGSVDSLNASNLLNPFGPLHRSGQGTYNYRGDWNMLDQIIISQGLLKGVGLKANVASSGILQEEWMKQQEGNYKGYPDRTYAGPRYLGGYSDHFPIYIDLVK